MQQTQIVHILGVRQRSGTNFLYSLLQHHRDISVGFKIAEDYFLSYYHHIENFFSDITARWSKKWDPDDRAKSELRNQLGMAYKNFFLSENSNRTSGVQFKKIVLTKTPSVENLDLFTRLPDSKAVVIVRDGRSVVESAMQSFGVSFRRETRAWSQAAQMIRGCIERGQEIHLVKYENLFLNTEFELRRIFDFLNIDADVFPYSKVVNSPIIGSCSESKVSGRVTWRPIEQTEDFNPLRRWEHWSAIRHLYFNAVAGSQMRYFGYETTGLDLGWRGSYVLAKQLK